MGTKRFYHHKKENSTKKDTFLSDMVFLSLIGYNSKYTSIEVIYMKMTELIALRRKQLGLTYEELGKKIGVSKSTVRKWEKGMITNIKSAHIRELCINLHIPLAWLLEWQAKGEFEVDENRITPLEELSTFNYDERKLTVFYYAESEKIDDPNYGYNLITAALNIEILNPYYPKIKNGSSNFRAYVANDKSMNKIFSEGDYCIIKTTYTSLKNGDIILFVKKGTVGYCFRKYYKIDNDIIVLKCESDDTTFQNEIISTKEFDQFHLLGIYIGACKPYSDNLI